MTLSIIIVNYNVKYFLEQCLCSVERALASIEGEVIVVDNQSTDGSLAYLQPKFPTVRFIESLANLGFGKACNLGLQEAKGEYILYLNPDTLIAEDSLAVCLRFFAQHSDCGAIGVKMLDGSGRFLKESKRSFPSPLTSFYKLSGLARLFPRSKTFGRYHLGHLSNDDNHEVDVLAGAFMMVRRDVLDQTGGFDERFFMYGEDVDLSYRIQKAGYKNYYVADTRIIHFKGESTKRGSLNYVRMFYKAMSLFVHKHYGGTKAGVFTASIEVAIWARAAITALSRFFRWVGLPFFDALLILLSFWLAKEIWITYVRTDITYPGQLLKISFPSFTLAYLLVAYYAGLYDRYYQLTNLIRSTSIATVGLLALYALLPEDYRFSRGVVVLGALLAFVLIGLARWIGLQTGLLKEPKTKQAKPHLLIAGSEKEFEAAKVFLAQRNWLDKVLGRVSINENTEKALCSFDQVGPTAVALNATELVLIAGQLSFKQIIERSEELGRFISLRYHTAGSGSIVGSDEETTSGETLSLTPHYSLEDAANRRLKRLMDVVTSVLFIISFPIQLFLMPNPIRFIKNAFSVMLGQKTWIGYILAEPGLPTLRPSVLGSNGFNYAANSQLPQETLQQLDFWYAQDYEPIQDLRILFRNYKKLGS